MKSKKFVDVMNTPEVTYAQSTYSLELFASFVKKKQFEMKDKPSRKNNPNVFALSFRTDGLLESMPNDFKFFRTIWYVFIVIYYFVT